MSCSVLHHIEVCVKDEKIIRLLSKGFGFTPFAYRVTDAASKLALRSGNSIFVVVKRKPKSNQAIDRKQIKDSANIYSQDVCENWTVFCCENEERHNTDSVFNVALVVTDVDSATQKVRSRGGKILREPTDLPGETGHVRYSIVRSCCGNIVHTLIDNSNFNGYFLPGFDAIDQKSEKFRSTLAQIISYFTDRTDFSSINDLQFDDILNNEVQSTSFPLSTHIDHVTYVCEIGKSKELLSWYEFCFGMKRFLTNRDESEEEGFVLADNIGLRLKVMEYWKCAEAGLTSPEDVSGDSSLKLVIAEPLPEVSTSHVDQFLKAHKGPGVQHIGLHTPTMVATVDFMARNGVVFRKAPPTYYEEGIKLEEIVDAGHAEEVKLFKELGILLDTEADVFTEKEKNCDRKSYLMQVFTGPIFDEDTFFLEVIQRRGARGFGSGNITALARSIILHNQRQ